MRLCLLTVCLVATAACSSGVTAPTNPDPDETPATTSESSTTTAAPQSTPTLGDPTAFIDDAGSLIAAFSDGSVLFTRAGTEIGCEGQPRPELWLRDSAGSESAVLDPSGAPLIPGHVEISPRGSRALSVDVCEEFLQSVVLYDFAPPASFSNPIEIPVPTGGGGGRATFYPGGHVRLDVVQLESDQFQTTAYRYNIGTGRLSETGIYFLAPYSVVPWTDEYDVMVVPSPTDGTRVMVGPQSSEALFTVLGESFQLSPDRTKLAAWSFPDPERPEVPPLVVLDLATGEQDVVFSGGIHRLAWSPSNAEIAFRVDNTLYFSDLANEAQSIATDPVEGCQEDWVTNAGAPLLFTKSSLLSGIASCDYGSDDGDFVIRYQIWQRALAR